MCPCILISLLVFFVTLFPDHETCIVHRTWQCNTLLILAPWKTRLVLGGSQPRAARWSLKVRFWFSFLCTPAADPSIDFTKFIDTSLRFRVLIKWQLESWHACACSQRCTIHFVYGSHWWKYDRRSSELISSKQNKWCRWSSWLLWTWSWSTKYCIKSCRDMMCLIAGGNEEKEGKNIV